MELKSVFEQIQAAERAGNLSPEEKQRLEEQAAEKGIQTLFKVRHYVQLSLSRCWSGLSTGCEARGRVGVAGDLRPDT